MCRIDKSTREGNIRPTDGRGGSITHIIVEVYYRAHNRVFSKRISNYIKVSRILRNADSEIIQRRMSPQWQG